MNLTAPSQIANYIAGSLQVPINGKYIDNINPATGEVYSQTPDSDIKDVEEAIGAARAQVGTLLQLQLPCSKKYRWNWAVKTQISYSRTATGIK